MISRTAVVETNDVGSTTSIGEFAVVRAGVRLGTGVVIHPHVVIEPSVEVGERAAVAAGALVDRNVPAHRMAAGSPAKHYKKIPAKLIQKFNEPESGSG